LPLLRQLSQRRYPFAKLQAGCVRRVLLHLPEIGGCSRQDWLADLAGFLADFLSWSDSFFVPACESSIAISSNGDRPFCYRSQSARWHALGAGCLPELAPSSWSLYITNADRIRSFDFGCGVGGVSRSAELLFSLTTPSGCLYFFFAPFCRKYGCIGIWPERFWHRHQRHFAAVTT